jgi:hypothetical protein
VPFPSEVMHRLDINNRFAGAEQRVFLTDEAIICRTPSRESSGLNLSEIRTGVSHLVDAGCMPAPVCVDDPLNGSEFRWGRAGKLTYWWEWPAEGWRVAAIVALRTLDALERANLTLVNFQPSDLFMNGSRPFLVNLFALGRWSSKQEEKALEQIERYFIRPVACAVHERAHLARRLLRGSIDGLSAADASIVAGTPVEPHRSRTEAISRLETAAMPWHGRRWSWAAYQDDVDRLFPEEAAAKTAVLQSLLTRMKPASVLDIACNRGRYAQLASIAGASVTGLDTDEGCMNAFFMRTSTNGTRAASVVMDIRDPAMSRGWGEGWCVPAEQRLSSECVMVLAVLHHIVLGMRMNANELRRLFGALAERWLLIEMAPKGAGHFYNHGSEFYTLDWLLAVLGEQFVKEECWFVGHRGRFSVLLRRK